MIQFNLLPDVKLEYVKARKLKHAVITVSILVAAGSLAVLVILFGIVNGIQKRHLSNLDKDITEYSDTLRTTPDLDKILTIQNQLKSMTDLHEQKVSASRLQDYISQVAPAQSTFAELTVDFTESTIKITGAADSLRTVNLFIDTLKFTTYKVDNETEEEGNAFSEIVLSSFARDEEGANYEIDFKFHPVIFENTTKVTLTVPNNFVTTRSVIERPQTLFQPQRDIETDEGQ
jgi:hypothetical protein